LHFTLNFVRSGQQSFELIFNYCTLLHMITWLETRQRRIHDESLCSVPLPLCLISYEFVELVLLFFGPRLVCVFNCTPITSIRPPAHLTVSHCKS
uniref:Ovule protein n=1 Tax=Haemonchus placei TaxID=6290 RepID=A0A0N4WRK9_HAEPC